jgi:aminoglycoside phosphotransferase family enzyme/predicted kinase
LDRRRRCCEIEFALGRRMAPKLYTALHRVTREPDGALVLDGAGEPVEWVVEMRRFDQALLFDRLAESRQLTPQLMRRLADEIARFHQSAERIDDRGGADSVGITIEDGARNLRLTPEILPAAEVEQWHATARSALTRVSGLLDRRRDEGRMRRCHGDLHLRNICLLDGDPTLFDPIEFSDKISCIDVLYDMAFLLMDLLHRHLVGLANLSFNRYLDRTDENDGLAALPLFLSLRAMIRAHVSAAQRTAAHDAATRDATAAQARSYLDLALALLQPAGVRLVAIGGFSGTGKTTLAQMLAPRLGLPPGARVVRSDVLRKRLAGVAPETKLPSSAYAPAKTVQVYEALGSEIAAALAAGYVAIADAAFLRPEERTDIERVAREQHVPFVGLWLDGPPHLLAERLATRQDDASDAGARVLRMQLSYDLGRIDWHRIDVSRDLATRVAEARRHISANELRT